LDSAVLFKIFLFERKDIKFFLTKINDSRQRFVFNQSSLSPSPDNFYQTALLKSLSFCSSLFKGRGTNNYTSSIFSFAHLAFSSISPVGIKFTGYLADGALHREWMAVIRVTPGNDKTDNFTFVVNDNV
jgi:hypothetical protein